jgi:hypothetical protein
MKMQKLNRSASAVAALHSAAERLLTLAAQDRDIKVSPKVLKTKARRIAAKLLAA